MQTIAGGKTPCLCLEEALPAEVDALGISICDTTRDGSRIVGKPEVMARSGVLEISVAVGTIITDRPPHRSVRARLRIRLLRRMSGVEACIGIGVQNAGRRNPPVQDWGKTFPTHLCALAAANQNTLP